MYYCILKKNKGRTNSKSEKTVWIGTNHCSIDLIGALGAPSNVQTPEKATNKLGFFVYCMLAELIERSSLSARFMEHKTRLVRCVCEKMCLWTNLMCLWTNLDNLELRGTFCMVRTQCVSIVNAIQCVIHIYIYMCVFTNMTHLSTLLV